MAPPPSGATLEDGDRQGETRVVRKGRNNGTGEKAVEWVICYNWSIDR